MKLSEKIMILRKQKGWSQEELAEKLEVSRQAVSKWESGQASPDIEKILKMSQLFEVSTDVLLKEEYDVDATEEAKEPEPIPSAPHTTPTSLTIFRSAFWPLMVAVYLVYSFFLFAVKWSNSASPLTSGKNNFFYRSRKIFLHNRLLWKITDFCFFQSVLH